MSDAEKMTELEQRYARACHAMQSAVATYIAVDTGLQGDALLRALKHLRVGINSAMSDQGALATLLLHKGVFTELEYMTAITEAAEREAETNAEKARQLLRNPNLKFA